MKIIPPKGVEWVGIEDEQQALWCRALGFTEGQKHLFMWPLSPVDAVAFLRIEVETGIVRLKKKHIDIPITSVPTANARGEVKFDVDFTVPETMTIKDNWKIVDEHGTEMLYGDLMQQITANKNDTVTFNMDVRIDGGFNPEVVFGRA